MCIRSTCCNKALPFALLSLRGTNAPFHSSWVVEAYILVPPLVSRLNHPSAPVMSASVSEPEDVSSTLVVKTWNARSGS